MLGELRSRATRPTCTRSATTCCSGSARTSTQQGPSRWARRSRSSTSPTSSTRRASHQSTLGQGWSEAESDHHAFLYWPATNLVVIPFGQQAVALRVSRAAGLTELGRIVHNQARQSQLPQIDRSLVVGSALFTVSSAGTASNRLTGLGNLGWAPFPPPVPVPFP